MIRDGRCSHLVVGSSAGLFAIALTRYCYADGIDIVWYLTRVDGWKRDPQHAALMIAVIAVIDYILNLIVVGVAAVRSGVGVGRVLKDLVPYTVLAQVADRLGALLGGLISVGIQVVLSPSGERGMGFFAWLLIVSNFLLPGAFIYLITSYFASARWRIDFERRRRLALRSAILTNPAWAIVLGSML